MNLWSKANPASGPNKNSSNTLPIQSYQVRHETVLVRSGWQIDQERLAQGDYEAEGEVEEGGRGYLRL